MDTRAFDLELKAAVTFRISAGMGNSSVILIPFAEPAETSSVSRPPATIDREGVKSVLATKTDKGYKGLCRLEQQGHGR